MNQNTKHEVLTLEVPQVPAQAQTEAAAILSMIERFARDPSVDIDRLERLMNMQREATERAAKRAFIEAKADMQPDLPVIDEKGAIRNREGAVQSTYAKWEDINEAINPIMKAHGFVLTFRTETTETRVITTGILAHREGHSEEATFNLPVDTGPGRNAVQSVASAFSYGKRYAAIALLNITSRAKQDTDDDAEGTTGYVTEEMLIELRELMEAVGAKEPAFCKLFLKVESLGKTPAKKFPDAIAELKRFGREKGVRL